MIMYKKFFSIAKTVFSVESESELDFGVAEKYFLCHCDEKPELNFTIKNEKVAVNGNLLHCGNIFSVYEKDNIFYRRFTNKFGDFVLTRDKNNPFNAVLYTNPNDLAAQSANLIQGYFGLEVPLICNQTYILHSSLIKINDYTVLFSAPSGTGKSTQADLWQRHKNAEILNGDRSCIRISGETAHAYGSFFAGSSDIYKNDGAPIKAIIFLEQSEENNLQKLSPPEAFKKLYSQSLNNTWDADFVHCLVNVVEKTVSLVPVYKLSCRPDCESVDLVYNKLFKSE